MNCFELVEHGAPVPEDGEVLVRTLFLSVDPYMRGRMRDSESYADPWSVGEPLHAGVVGEVVESRHDDWETGDVVVVTAAAGAVGSVVGQIAGHAGCDVVGIAGADGKIDWLDDIGFDAAINYETEDVDERLGEISQRFPSGGIDVYFDNVGGPITDAAFGHLNVGARVPACGQISLYNAEETPVGPRKLPGLISTRARVEGFLVRDFADRHCEATRRLARWIDEGVVDYRETVTEGLEQAPEAFLGLFDGVNVGKQLVKVAERERADA
jgi:NADPH-dependent curcumin reductase CurA